MRKEHTLSHICIAQQRIDRRLGRNRRDTVVKSDDYHVILIQIQIILASVGTCQFTVHAAIIKLRIVTALPRL